MSVYNTQYEKFLISCFLYNPSVFSRCKTILSEKFFKNKESLVMKYILEYNIQHETLPTPQEVEAIYEVKYDEVSLCGDTQKENAVLTEVEKFCRQKACENAIYDSPDLIAKGREEEIIPLMQKAVMTSLPNSFGIDPFSNISEGLVELHKQQGEVQTKWKEVDETLQGGLGYGEIEVFTGVSGGGKSLSLQNISINLVGEGLNVLYFTLELSEHLIMKRLAAMVSGFNIRNMKQNEDQVELAVNENLEKLYGNKRGQIRVIYERPGITTMEIESIVKEYELRENITVNAIIIDYADLVDPVRRISAENIHLHDKYVYEELRSIAMDRTNKGKKTLVITASQLTKEAADVTEYSYGKVAGGVTKAYTADNMFSVLIKKNPEDERNCPIKFTFLKTRNSSGTGRSITLGYDMHTLRIKDYEVEIPTKTELNELMGKKEEPVEEKDILDEEIIGNNKILENLSKKQEQQPVQSSDVNDVLNQIISK